MKNTILEIVHTTVQKSALKEIESGILLEFEEIKKWMCYSDYCFDDNRKPNDVVTFTLVPYIYDFGEFAELIRSVAKVDIKKTRKVHPDFIKLLNNMSIINFSFVLKNKKRMSHSPENFNKVLRESFQELIAQCDLWIKNTPEMEASYLAFKKKYNCVLDQINNKKKLNLIADMSLVTMLGAYVSSLVVRKCQPELFGWFSDRDAINEICEGVSATLFHSNLCGLTEFKGQFAYAPAGSNSNPFYEEFVRIPDYIAGTLADLDTSKDVFSKEKFLTIYTGYMADNTRNNFVFELDFERNSCCRMTVNRTSKR